MHVKKCLALPVFLAVSSILVSMPSSSTDYAIINHSNENIRLTVIPKFELHRGMPEKQVHYYKNSKYVLTLFIKECVKREKELLLVDDQAPSPFYTSMKNSAIIMDLAGRIFSDIESTRPIEILHYLIDDITIYDMQDNVILTYSDITEDSIGEMNAIIITQEIVDAGRTKYRERGGL
jgi:hypothetical protein